MRNNQLRGKQFCLDYLGNKCIKCGSNENLEFDHINPKTKSFSISTKYDYSKDILIPELIKCQLLCKKHHLRKTQAESAARITHGKYWARYKCRCDCDECVKFAKNYSALRRYKRKQASVAQ